MPPLLEAKQLTKRYGDTLALDAVDFEVHEGVTGLLGPNGAGKSTSIKLFLGLLRPTSGSAELSGVRPYESISARARMGYMPEHDCLPTSTTATEFLTHMAQVSGLPAAQARTRAADTLRHVGLHEERYRSIGEYSTGMKQRVKLAQSIVHDPVIVLLDEPTAGLDPAGRDEMLELIQKIGKEFGISVVISTHLIGDVERICDRVILLEGGKVTQQGEVSSYTQETQTLYIEIDGKLDDLLAALAKRKVQATADGGIILIEQATDVDYDAIRDAIVEVDARLRRLAPGCGRLTDMFRSAPK
ncbi:MAG: ABC transporter ATP-binding protein [SAR202 cluster bacterium]|nr:ABC transporter ATP-binding protein [SAR202 cluster bacterium]